MWLRGPVRAARVVGVEAELQHDHARVAEPVAQPLDRRRDDAQVLGDQRQLAPQRRGRGVEHRAARPAPPAAAERVARAGRHRPVGHEAAEVVDAREVDELEGPPQARHPPAVAAPLQRRPVVDRVAPQLALVGERVRRRARDHAGLEELGMGAVLGAARRDVDRHVADQPHAAGLARAPAAPTTRARSAPGPRARRGRRSAPSRPPRAPRARGSPAPRRAATGARGSASSPGQAANAERALYGEP